MNEIDMSKDDKLGALRSTGKNGQKRNISNLFYLDGWRNTDLLVPKSVMKRK